MTGKLCLISTTISRLYEYEDAVKVKKELVRRLEEENDKNILLGNVGSTKIVRKINIYGPHFMRQKLSSFNCQDSDICVFYGNVIYDISQWYCFTEGQFPTN